MFSRLVGRLIRRVSLGFRHGIGKHFEPRIVGTVGGYPAERVVPGTRFSPEPHVHDQGKFWTVIEYGLAPVRVKPDLDRQEAAAISNMKSHRFLKIHVLDGEGMHQIGWDFGAGQELNPGAEPFVFGIRVVVSGLEFQDLSNDGHAA